MTMGGEPNKRRLAWLTQLRLNALGRVRRRKPQSNQASPSGSSSVWPTLNESASSRLGGQVPPGWESVIGGPDPTGNKRPPRTLWQRFQSAPRSHRVGLLAGAGGLLAALIVVAALCSRLPLVASGTPTTGGANGQSTHTTGSTTATASATATVTVTPAAPFSITFTCASGAIRHTGKVCVHTQSNATLRLTVRYCDGSYAGGKGIHENATANSNGDYTWQFAVRTRCAGKATATVTATSKGKTVTQSTTFTITR